MSVFRLIGILVVIVVIYAIVTQPVNSASMTRDGVSQLGVAGDRVTQFLSNIVSGVGGQNASTGSHQTRVLPTGGIETGDGSTEIH